MSAYDEVKIKVRPPFSNGTQFQLWKECNCYNCKAYDLFYREENGVITNYCPALDMIEIGYRQIDWEFLKTCFDENGNCKYRIPISK